MITYENLTQEKKAELDKTLNIYFYLDSIADVEYMEFVIKSDFWLNFFWNKIPNWINTQLSDIPNNSQHKTKTPSCTGVELGGGC